VTRHRARWWDQAFAPARPLVVRSPRGIEEARETLEELLAGRGRPIAPRRSPRVFVVDGVVDGAEVSFQAVPVSRRGTSGDLQPPPPLAFAGTIAADPDGSVLAGSITAPMAFGIPAAGLTLLVALFLGWSGIPLPLVGVGVVAWVFLTAIVVSSLQEQRLREVDGLGRFLEEVLA
jgi:hypothetical protein